MTMTPAELQKELSGGKFRPAYLLAGSEALLQGDALAAMRAALFQEPGASDFNFDRLDGERSEARDLLESVGRLPIPASARRLVILRNPEARRGQASRALCDAIAAAVEMLRERSDAVLVVCADKVDRRQAWVKAFREPAVQIACDPPKSVRETAAFVRKEAKAQGIRLERGAAEALAEAVGRHLLPARVELQKAALLAGPKNPVGPAEVALGVVAHAEESIFALTDAVGEGRSADALAVLQGLLGAGTPPPVLLGMLAGHFRKLCRARSGAKLSGSPFAARKVQQQARRFSPQRLRMCLRAIHDADCVLKGQGGMSGEFSIERLVLGLSA